MPMRDMHCSARDGVQQRWWWGGLHDRVLCSGVSNHSITLCPLRNTLCTTDCIVKRTASHLRTITQWCCEEEMQGEMTPLSTCLLFTVSPDDTAARTAVPTHVIHTIYVCQHCHTVVHVRYAHTHEWHAWYGRVGRHCSLPTYLSCCKGEYRMGECNTQRKTRVIIQCIHDTVHFSIHTCSHTSCLLATHDAMGLDYIFYHTNQPRIFILASWISLWCHTLPLHSTMKSYYLRSLLVEFMCMISSTFTTHSQCMLQGWSDALTLPYLLFHFHDSSCIFTHQCIISHN